MIIELGSGAEFIRVTAEYSNAVLVAMLPHVSAFAQKLDLPVPHPITPEHVVRCGVLPWRDRNGGISGGSVSITGGWTFSYQFGYVGSFSSPHCYYGLQDPGEIPKYFGQVHMSQDEVIDLARKTIGRLGISLEQVFAQLEPHVTLPERIGTNTVPHYRLEWIGPRGACSVEVEVDADARRIERLWMLNKSLERPPPKVSVVPPRETRYPRSPPVNPEYAWRLIPVVLRAVDEYGRKLSLRIPCALTTNHVARFSVADNGGWPHCEVELTNGWRFIYRNSMVNGYYAPDNLFNSDNRPILIKEFLGDWRMTEQEAIELIRRTMAKLDYPSNLVHMDFKPETHKPALPGIPRYSIHWRYENASHDDLQSKVEAEVDADKRELKSLYYDDKAYWNHPPPIDVPLSLPPEPETNATPAKVGRQPGLTPKPPLRPLTPLLPSRHE